MNKKICLWAFLLLITGAAAQSPPPGRAAFTYNGSVWSAAQSTTSLGAIAFTPPAISLYCQFQATATFTNSSASIAATNSFTAGALVQFLTTGALPAGFSTTRSYFVLSAGLSGSAFEVAVSPGGTAITAGSAGSGTQTVAAYVPATSSCFGGGGGSGVTSVALVGSANIFSSTPGTPVTTSGTLNLDSQLLAQAANCVLAGPTTGSSAAPTCRLLVNADFSNSLAPTISAANMTNFPASATTFPADAGIANTDTTQWLPSFSPSNPIPTSYLTLPASPGQQYIAPQALSGCGVEYVTGLTYTVGACVYQINGVTYTTTGLQSVTLPAADPSNPTIDVIFIDGTGVAQYIEGTPAATPEQPTVDPSTQLALTFVLVNAAATTPANTTVADIYMNGSEWTTAKGGTSSANVNLLSTNNPYPGATHDIEFGTSGTVATTTYAQATDPAAGTVNLANYNYLIFYIRNKAAWPAKRSVTAQWFNGATAEGTPVVISNGAFGFNALTNTSTYQQLVIPVSTFQTNSTLLTTIRFTVTGSGAALTGFYLGQVTIQAGTSIPGLPATLMNWRGTWNSTTAYNPNDEVVSGGIGYVALVANTNVAVSTTSTWAPLAPTSGSTGYAVQNTFTFASAGAQTFTHNLGTQYPLYSCATSSGTQWQANWMTWVDANNVTMNAPSATTTSCSFGQTTASTAVTLPPPCPDSSASGTAKTCTTTPTITVAANSCIAFSSTTANSGTGLTLAVNGGAAKSIAVPGSSGWTTTLSTSPASIQANKSALACYDGTNWDVQQTGVVAAVVAYPTPVTLTASSSSELDFTTCLTGSYSDYQIRLRDIVRSSDTAALMLQVSTNGGSSYDSNSGHYVWSRYWVAVSTSGTGSTANTSDVGFALNGGATASGNIADAPIAGSFTLFGVNTTTTYKDLQGSAMSNSNSITYGNIYWQEYTGALSAINAIRVIPSAGTITSGTVTCQPLPQ